MSLKDSFVVEKRRLIDGSWLKRGEKNWHLNGFRASCDDNNFGNVAAFSKETFHKSKNASILLTFNVTKQAVFPQCRVGIVNSNYPATFNSDFRTHGDYGFFDRTAGNKPLGEVTSVFNMGVSLTGAVWVQGRQTQLACITEYPRGSSHLRIDINSDSGEARVSFPSWGDRTTVETIGSSQDLRVAVCFPRGCSLDIQYITEPLTLKAEARIDMTLDDAKLEEKSKERCRKLVEKIRRLTADEPINLIVIGEFGVGKSSFINTLLTAFSDGEDDVGDGPRTDAYAAKASTHCTTYFEQYQLQGTQLTLVDSVGVQKVNEKTMNYSGVSDELLRGNINRGFRGELLSTQNVLDVRRMFDEFQIHTDSDEKTPEKMGLKLHLDAEGMNHGALVVVVPSLADSEDAGLSDAIGQFRQENASFPILGIVTQLDQNHPEFSLRMMFEDPEVADNFQRAKNLVQGKCFPVRCYHHTETQQNWAWNYLAVEALNAIVVQAVRYKKRCRQAF